MTTERAKGGEEIDTTVMHLISGGVKAEIMWRMQEYSLWSSYVCFFRVYRGVGDETRKANLDDASSDVSEHVRFRRDAESPTECS